MGLEEVARLIFREGLGHRSQVTAWTCLLLMTGTLLARSVVCMTHCQPRVTALPQRCLLLCAAPITFSDAFVRSAVIHVTPTMCPTRG